jgi:hypothetical protein
VNTPINGSDVFHYTVSDGTLSSNSESITFKISDTAPVANNDSFSLTEVSGQTYPLTYATRNVLTNDTDGGGGTLAVNALDGHTPLSGSYTDTLADGNSLTLYSEGAFAYTVNTPVNGSDVFHYTVSDGTLSSNSASITFNVSDTARCGQTYRLRFGISAPSTKGERLSEQDRCSQSRDSGRGHAGARTA